MFLKLILSFLIILFSSTAYCADWTADPNCLWALTFDEKSGNFNDVCGSTDGTTTESSPLRVEGKFFGGAGFTAGVGIVDMGDSSIWDSKNVLTVSLWLQTQQDMSPFEAEIFYKNSSLVIDDSANQQRAMFWTSAHPTGNNNVFTDDDYPTNYLISEDGNWHMYTITYDSNTVKAFRDCVQVGTDKSQTGTISNSSNRFFLGRKPSEESGPTYPYVGNMDDIIILDKVISSNECLDLMENGIDGSAGHHDTMFKGYNIKLNKVVINGS